MALPAISLTLPATPPAVIPAAPVDDYLSFAPQALPARPFGAIAKFYDYVDRYPLTLKTAFIADYNAGKAPSQALWGQQHWFGSGLKQGRVLEIIDGTEDVNDYGAYVENYGTTLLDIYRASPDSNPASDSFKSLFNWGKDHYNTVGKAAGRQIGGGADFGAIVKTMRSQRGQGDFMQTITDACDFFSQITNMKFRRIISRSSSPGWRM